MSLKTAKELVTQAKSTARNLNVEEFARAANAGNAVVLDLREPAERREHGAVPGAVHVPRGMLEFHADPTSPYHKKEIEPTRRVLLYCASGGRSALAAQTLVGMGFGDVAHLDTGFKSWTEAGRPVAPVDG